MLNLGLLTKEIEIKYKKQKIHFTIKKIPVGVKNYVTSLMLSGTKIDTKNPGVIEGLAKWNHTKEAGEVERQVLLAGVMDTDLTDENGNKIKWNMAVVNELLNNYPDIAIKLYQKIWDFNQIDGESL